MLSSPQTERVVKWSQWFGIGCAILSLLAFAINYATQPAIVPSIALLAMLSIALLSVWSTGQLEEYSKRRKSQAPRPRGRRPTLSILAEGTRLCFHLTTTWTQRSMLVVLLVGSWTFPSQQPYSAYIGTFLTAFLFFVMVATAGNSLGWYMHDRIAGFDRPESLKRLMNDLVVTEAEAVPILNRLLELRLELERRWPASTPRPHLHWPTLPRLHWPSLPMVPLVRIGRAALSGFWACLRASLPRATSYTMILIVQLVGAFVIPFVAPAPLGIALCFVVCVVLVVGWLPRIARAHMARTVCLNCGKRLEAGRRE